MYNYKSEHIGNPTFGSERVQGGNTKSLKEVMKGVWGMPWLSEAKKDVISCDKLGGFANRNYIPRFPNGETR